MDPQQMAMPAEMAAQGPSPEEMAVYDQMRQQISPQEFSNEMLASASQVDPQAVAEFTEELQSLDISPEELDALNDLVDEVLANPEQYDQLRQKYLSQGLPDDILPEQFDPYFFAALNMAVDQMIAAPTGVQAFAEGGIAELKPIAQAIASYGRNGDTMLAHITPAEARMLRRRGGSGTINPVTGLPEFFLKKAFKKIGNAVKKFANSTVGRIVTTVALGFFLGPAAASALGVSSAAGVAAVSGFVGGAGSTLLGGGNLRDALKAGAIGGLTAGAGAGIMGGSGAFQAGSYTGPTTIGGQFDKFKSAITPGAPAISPTGQVPGQAPVPDAGAPAGVGPNQMPVPSTDPLGDFIQQNEAARAAANAPARLPGASTPAPYKTPTIGESFSKMGEGLGMGEGPASFDTFKQGAKDLFSPGPTNAQLKLTPEYADAISKGKTMTAALAEAAKANAPGFLRTYGPGTLAGIGAISAFGGFESKPVQGGDITKSLMKPVTQRIREQGTQRQMYMQGLPGVVYDENGEPIFGQSTRLPTYDVPDYNYGGFNLPPVAVGGQGIMNLPTTYTSPAGAIGSRTVAQPYNTASMYTNLMPRGYADGGEIAPVAPLADAAKPPTKTPAELAAERQAALENMIAQQRAGQQAANQARAMRRAGGSGQMYANINAGLAGLAPENFPGAPVKLDAAREAEMRAAFTQPKTDIEYARVMQEKGYRPEEVAALTGRTFGDINRRYNTAIRQDAYAPMLQGQRNAMAEQARVLGGGAAVAPPTVLPPGQPPTTQLPITVLPPVTQPPVTQPPVVKTAVTNQQVADYLAANSNLTDRQIRDAMDQFGVGVDQMAAVTGLPVDQVQQRYNTASKFTNQDIQNYLAANPNMTDAQIRSAMDQFGVGTAQMAAATGLPLEQVQARYDAAAQPGEFMHFGIDEYGRGAGEGFGTAPPPGMQPIYQPAPAPQFSNPGGIPKPPSVLDADVQNWLGSNPGASDRDIRTAMDQFGVGVDQMARVTGLPLNQVQQRYNTAFMNQGGIAALAQGGYPRRTGQISGPGTEKSDSIPAMLSDGEFVMTAKAVRGAGKGSRRAGAKQMYKLMHQLEKNAERG